MKTVNIHGKEYVTVASRVEDFRKDYPNGKIITDILNFTQESVIVKAEVQNGEGGSATGIAHEIKSSTGINKTSFIENAETSAIGRALAFLGYGTETGIASAEEVKTAIESQSNASKIDEDLKALPDDIKKYLKDKFSTKTEMVNYLVKMMWDVDLIRSEFSI